MTGVFVRREDTDRAPRKAAVGGHGWGSGSCFGKPRNMEEANSHRSRESSARTLPRSLQKGRGPADTLSLDGDLQKARGQTSALFSPCVSGTF